MAFNQPCAYKKANWEEPFYALQMVWEIFFFESKDLRSQNGLTLTKISSQYLFQRKVFMGWLKTA